MKHFAYFLSLGVGFLALTSHITAAAQGTPPPPPLSLTTIATGLTEPLAIEQPPSETRLFVAERAGRVKIVDPVAGTVAATPFLNIVARVNSTAPRHGLLGLVFHPQYTTNGQFYVSYVDLGAVMRIVRYTRSAGNPDQADTTTRQLIYSSPIPPPNVNRNGGCLKFGPDGYLYIALGDAAGGLDPTQRAQDLMLASGKVLRIDVSGALPFTVPPTNPFVGQPNALPEIWARGLRHPWRFSFDRQNGDIWLSDVGQDSVEEINYIPASQAGGQNFGWPCFEGDRAVPTATGCGAATSYHQPVITYRRTVGQANTGGYVYRGSRYPALQGHYVFADLILGKLFVIEQRPVGPITVFVLHTDTLQHFGIASFGEDNAGELYAADVVSGEILRVGVAGPAGIGEGNRVADLQLWPNPAQRTCQLTWTGLATGPAQLVSLVTGQVLRTQMVSGSVGTLDLSGLPAGCYAVRVATAAGPRTARLVVQ